MKHPKFKQIAVGNDCEDDNDDRKACVYGVTEEGKVYQYGSYSNNWGKRHKWVEIKEYKGYEVAQICVNNLSSLSHYVILLLKNGTAFVDCCEDGGLVKIN